MSKGNTAIYWHWLLGALLWVCSELASAQRLPQAASYSNESVGIKLVLSPQWQLYTSAATAPEPISGNFPPDKGPDDSPLFLGLHQSQTLFTRLLIEPFYDDIEAYARQLAKSLAAEGMALLNAATTADHSAVQIEYVHRGLGLYFIERVALLQDSRVLRFAFWTPLNQVDAHAEEIAAAYDTVELRDVQRASSGYQAVWRQLPSRLQTSTIAGIDLPLRDSLASEQVLQCQDPSATMAWEVSGGAMSGRTMSMHVLGSIHVGKPDFYPLASPIEQWIAGAETLVFEIDPTQAALPATAAMIQQRGILPGGLALNQVISTDTMALLRTALTKLNIPSAMMANMRPWLVTLMLTNIQVQALGYSNAYGIESYLLAKKPDAARIVELESLDQQLGLLESLDQEELLRYSLEDFESIGSQMDQLVGAWRCGDHAGLEKILFAANETDEDVADLQAARKALMKRIFDDRNAHMADELVRLISQGSGDYFVVVGAGHLLGDNNVLELLQQQGFTITPVRR